MYADHKIHHVGDSGLDLFITSDVCIEAGETKLVDLGIKCQLVSLKWYSPWKKQYHSYLLVPRSSISKTPLRLANSIGLIDAGYTGELKAALCNTGTVSFTLHKGDRYVQLVRPDLGQVELEVVNKIRSTSRSDGGFGSTNLITI